MHSSPLAYDDLDLELRVTLDETIRRFEVAFLADPTTRLEAYLAAAPEPPARAALLLELLGVELECRRRNGQIPTVEEYLSRLAEDAETVRAAFHPSGTDRAGTHLGKYQLTRVIGRGGMGTVYAATDTVVNRPVAVKVLSEALAADRRAHEHLLREAQLVGRLLHPNVVTLFEAGEADGACFLVLEHVSGGSAAARLRRHGPFDWIVASRVVLDVCHGLAAAHAVGLVHRDIKPANILLLEAPITSPVSSRSKLPLAKLSDFGLARAAEDEARVGTPRYMAPEQVADGTSNPATDIYSLGATYFALLTGSPPFEAPTLAELQEAHRTAPVPDARATKPAIPEACARVVRRCLAKSPDERYQTVEQLIADLDSLLARTERPQPSRRRYTALALIGVVALGVVVGIVAVRIGAPARPPDDAVPGSAVAQSPGGSAAVLTKMGSWEPLFTGRDLTGWETRDNQGALRPDPGSIFTVGAIDGEPVVRVSGTKDLFLTTTRDYENYHLSLEFCWLSPLQATPNSGVLYHCNFIERHSIGHELELLPPDTGRYTFRNSPIKTRIDVGVLHQGQIVPGGEVSANTPLNHNWENKPGTWNRVDLICVGDAVLHVLNSKVLLALTRSRFTVGTEERPLTRGRIMLQSRRGGIAFQRIRIRSVDGIPPEFLTPNSD